MNEVGRRTQVAARTKVVGVARSVLKLGSATKHPKGNAGVAIPQKYINSIIGTAALVWRIYLPPKP